MTPLPSLLYLWDQRTLYIGPFTEALNLSQGAATLLVSLTEEIEFQTPDMPKAMSVKSLLLPPGLKVTIDTKNAIIANCNLDPMGSDWAAFSEQMTSDIKGVKINLEQEALYQDNYHNIYQEQLNAQDSYKIINALIDRAKLKQTQPHKVDVRIQSVIDNIKNNIDSNVSIESLAQSINLSVPRLVQLFKQQTGIPVRRYRLWHRLFITAIKISEGHSLTDAAISAGFADSAHFTHTFRSMLGMTPTSILLQKNTLKLNVC